MCVYSSYSFCLILTKLGIHDLCTNTQKQKEQIFKILILEFLVNSLILNLDLVSETA